MNTVDLIIILLLVPAAISGLRKGFIFQLVSLLSIIVGLWLSYRFSGAVADWLQPHLGVSGPVLRTVAFTTILILTGIALNLVGKALKGVIKFALLGWADKLLGLAFALLKAMIIVAVLILIVNSLNLKFGLIPQELLDSSVLYGPLRDLVYSVFPYFKEII